MKETKQLTAVIIKGNPLRITKENYNGLYEDLKIFLEKMGIEVFMADSEPHTISRSADIWIGHSRGVDRLRFAPKETLTIAMGSHVNGAINHPQEVISSKPEDYEKLTDEQKTKHLTLHPSMIKKIKKLIEERFSKI